MSGAELSFTVNGAATRLQVAPRLSLADVLREELGLTSVHVGCGHGVCGACTVLVDGVTMRACTHLALSLQGRTVETLEAVADRQDRRIAALQAAFLAHGGLQCGFCTPAVLLTAHELLGHTPRPSRAEIRMALSGNICRCTGYGPIVDAIEAAAQELAP